MLAYSMGVSVDGFIADREGAFGWSAPSEELFPERWRDPGLVVCWRGRDSE